MNVSRIYSDGLRVGMERHKRTVQECTTCRRQRCPPYSDLSSKRSCSICAHRYIYGRGCCDGFFLSYLHVCSAQQRARTAVAGAGKGGGGTDSVWMDAPCFLWAARTPHFSMHGTYAGCELSQGACASLCVAMSGMLAPSWKQSPRATSLLPLLEAIAARHLPAPRLRLPPIQANDAATATSASLLGNTTNGAVGLDDPGLLETLFPLKPSGAEDLPSDVDREHPAEALQDEEAGHGGLVLQHHMSPNRVLQQSVSAEVAAASDKVSCCVLGGCDVAACERGLSGEGRRGWGGSSAR